MRGFEKHVVVLAAGGCGGILEWLWEGFVVV